MLVRMRRDLLQIDRCAIGDCPVLLVARSGPWATFEPQPCLSVGALAQRGIPLLGLVVQSTHPSPTTPAPGALTGAPVLGLSARPLASTPQPQTLLAALARLPSPWHEPTLET